MFKKIEMKPGYTKQIAEISCSRSWTFTPSDALRNNLNTDST